MELNPSNTGVVMYQVPSSAAPPRQMNKTYKHKQALGLGITQIILGFCCIGVQIAAIVISAAYAVISAGIWCGVLFVLAGTFGIVSAHRRTAAWIMVSMILSILSAVFTAAILIVSAMGLENDEGRMGYYCDPWPGSCYGRYPSQREERMILNGLLIVLAVAEAVVAILASVICCLVVCCGKPRRNADPVVTYNTGSHGQPVVWMNQGQANMAYSAPQGQTPNQGQSNIAYFAPQGQTPNQGQANMAYSAPQGQTPYIVQPAGTTMTTTQPGQMINNSSSVQMAPQPPYHTTVVAPIHDKF